MSDQPDTNSGASRPLALRLLPAIVGLLGALVAVIVALVVGRPIPLDVAGALLALGLAATWVARAVPLRGALFVALLAAVVFGVGYGG